MTERRTTSRRRSTSGRLTGLLALAALAVGVGALPASASGPVASAAAHNCSVPHYPGLGYFTSLKVSGTSCSTGSKLAVAYYHCRTKSGVRGTCHSSTVLGFRCQEKRVSIETEIDGRVTCTRGSAKVVHTFQQNV